MPGAVGKSLRMMWKENSPVSIRPGLNLRLWNWLLEFARHCNEADMLKAGAARHALLQSSRQLFDQLVREESLGCEYETRGCLFAYQDRQELDAFAHVDDIQREQFGVGARKVDGAELAAMEPALKPGLAGAWYYEMDAHLRPDRLLESWRAVLVRRGATVLEHTSASGFAVSDQHVKALHTDKREIAGDAFIVAAGALTPLIEKHLGCRVPIQPGKGYSITMARPARCPKYPMIFPECKVAVTPFASGYRLGSTMELAGYDATLNRARLDALRRGAEKFLHEPYCDPVHEEWFGWRPMTSDGVPIIGRAPAAENLFIAAGHNMEGLSMAPATGKLVAELVTGERPHVAPAPYQVSRF
jgi:D-amino-acid dehydrogenase